MGLETRYSKDQVLEMYLNRVYYGHNAYGLGAATRIYFGAAKTASDLTPGQSAFLAGLINGPAYYDPALYFDRAKQRLPGAALVLVEPDEALPFGDNEFDNVIP